MLLPEVWSDEGSPEREEVGWVPARQPAAQELSEIRSLTEEDERVLLAWLLGAECLCVGPRAAGLLVVEVVPASSLSEPLRMRENIRAMESAPAAIERSTIVRSLPPLQETEVVILMSVVMFIQAFNTGHQPVPTYMCVVLLLRLQSSKQCLAAHTHFFSPPTVSGLTTDTGRCCVISRSV